MTTAATETANPWADYGLNADGTPLTAPKPEGEAKGKEGGEGDGEGKEKEAPDPRDAKIAALEKSLGEANEKLKGIDGLADKFKVVDRLVKALAGDQDPNKKTYDRVWQDLKEIAPPGVRKALEALEADPEALEKLTGSIGALHQGKLADLNQRAHDHVKGLAKKAFPTKGLSESEVNEMVFPFERAMTDIINSNRALRERFVGGDMTVIDELFNRLARPHVSARLKDKARRAEPSPFPKAPPKGQGAPGAASESKDDKKPDLKTPKGRAAFHKAAGQRFFAKAAARDEE